jgi:hypothetical protein
MALLCRGIFAEKMPTVRSGGEIIVAGITSMSY